MEVGGRVLRSLRSAPGAPVPYPLGGGADVPEAYTKPSPALRPLLREAEDGLWLVVTGGRDHKQGAVPRGWPQGNCGPSPSTRCLSWVMCMAAWGGRGLGAGRDPEFIRHVHSLCTG